MLKLIKILHTLIWLVMALAAIYILYAGLTNTFDLLLLVSISLLIMETLVLLINRWTCPLTPLARKYTSDQKDNFDIYLPEWLAKHNKIIFGTISIFGLFLLLINWISG